MDDKSKTQELSEKLQPLRQRLRLGSGFRRQWAFVDRVLPVMTLEIGFERNELMLDRTSRNFQDLYSSYLIQSRS